MTYQTIKVRFQQDICFLQFNRPEADNTINDRLIEECLHVLSLCEESFTVLVLEGSPQVFSMGADFREMHRQMSDGQYGKQGPEALYDLWLKLANGPHVTVSHVRGKVNAGGVGFVAASDIVVAGQTAQFSLSELLFGLMPALVLPFLTRRIGFQKAHYMTLMTRPVPAHQALEWGLIDACEENSQALLRKHLQRLKCLSKKGIARYKQYMNNLNSTLTQSRPSACAANKEVFSDPQNLAGISRFVETGKFPWQD